MTTARKEYRGALSEIESIRHELKELARGVTRPAVVVRAIRGRLQVIEAELVARPRAKGSR